MLNYLKYTIAFGLICLTFNSWGQYQLLIKGQKVVYDSAVAIEINQYRAIKHKLITADDYILGLQSQVDVLSAQIQAHEDLSETINTISEIQKSHIENQEKTISLLNQNFDKLLTKKPKIWTYVGAGIGGLILGLLWK